MYTPDVIDPGDETNEIYVCQRCVFSVIVYSVIVLIVFWCYTLVMYIVFMTEVV